MTLGALFLRDRLDCLLGGVMKWIRKSMKKREAVSPRQMLRMAERAARKGKSEDALNLYARLVDVYIEQKAGLRAVAVIKNARSILGPGPRIQGMLIKVYSRMGLKGDAKREFNWYMGRIGSIGKDDIFIFSGMDYEEFANFMDIMEIIKTKKGSYVIKQGHPGDDIYIVTEGKFEVIRDSTRVGILEEGDVFGEIGFFHHRLRTASVRSVDKGEVVRLPSAELRGLCNKYPYVEKRLETLYTERLLKKAGEDLMLGHSLSSYPVLHLHVSKGEELTSPCDGTITVVRKGTIEIDYDEEGLSVKRFMGPGSVFRHPKITARVKAASDVEIIQADTTSLGDPKDMP